MPFDVATLERAAARLRAGRLVAFATETVYGLGADALNPRAVARIFDAKGRPRFDPLIVHVADLAAARALIADLPAQAERLAAAFWPGPLTMVLPKAQMVPGIVTADLDTLAIRVPAHPLAQALLRAAGCAIAAPSANRFGSVSPTTAAHVREEFADMLTDDEQGEGVMVLDGGACTTGVESTVLSLVGDTPTILRPGGLTIDAIERVVGRVARQPHSTANPASPGMLDRHYAPRTPLDLVDDLAAARQAAGDDERVALLALSPVDFDAAARFAPVEILSGQGDLVEAAANLFAAMRRLDHAGVDRIVALRLPDRGLGIAMNDRLTRASCRV